MDKKQAVGTASGWGFLHSMQPAVNIKTDRAEESDKLHYMGEWTTSEGLVGLQYIWRP
jgi:hypothetical protein